MAAPSDLATPRATFPFVVGCQRSGTTLLQAMLDAHPEIAMAPESNFIPQLARRFTIGWHPSETLHGELADALLSRRRFTYWRMSRTEVVAALDEAGAPDFAGAIRTVYAKRAKSLGKHLYGDKTPSYVTKLPAIAGLFPEARFVHLIRDGRDVSLSLAAAFERGPRSAVEGAVYWRAAVESGRSAGEALGADRYLEVRYEDLVADPEPVAAAICGFAGIEPDDRMLRPAMAAARVAAGYPDPSLHRNLHRPIAARREWRTEMPRREVRRFELIAGDLLADLGYPRATEPPTGEALERRRREVVAAELIGLRRGVFAAERRAERLEQRLAAASERPWRRLTKLGRRR